MDRRFYILPLASVLLLLALLVRPEITGFMTAGGSSAYSSISANVTVQIIGDGFIPEGSLVRVSLDGRNASMAFGEFVAMTGSAFDRISENITEIGYYGNGFAGPHSYSLGISQFAIDTLVPTGNHTLAIAVIYGDNVLSNSLQTIET